MESFNLLKIQRRVKHLTGKKEENDTKIIAIKNILSTLWSALFFLNCYSEQHHKKKARLYAKGWFYLR